MTTSHDTAPDRTISIGADLLHRRRLQLAIAGLLAVVATVATLAVPLAVKDIIVAFGQEKSVTRPAVLMGVAVLGGAAASAVSGYLLARIGEHMILRVRRRIMDHTLQLPLSTVRSHGTGNLASASPPTRCCCAPWLMSVLSNCPSRP